MRRSKFADEIHVQANGLPEWSLAVLSESSLQLG